MFCLAFLWGTYQPNNICLSPREKKVLASSQDFGQDLTGVQNLKKKLQRLIGELKSHESRTESLLRQGDEFKKDNPIHEDEITSKCEHLSTSWSELNDLANKR